MGVEIERKFLVASDAWRGAAPGRRMTQAYLAADPRVTVRVRIAGPSAWLTVKGESQGASRAEFEYPIPVADAEAMIAGLCQKPVIEKTRYEVPFAGKTWEVDEFHGDNAGLVVAEIELEREGEAFAKPDWVGRDVTDDPRYLNANLFRNPYTRW